MVAILQLIWGDWLKEQDIYDISVTEDNESEGYKEMYYERNPEKEEKDEFYDTDDTAYIPFERLVYEGDVISYTDSSIETVTEVEENGDFYTKNHIYAEIAIKGYGLRYSVRLVGTLVVFTALDLMAEHIKRL